MQRRFIFQCMHPTYSACCFYDKQIYYSDSCIGIFFTITGTSRLVRFQLKSLFCKKLLLSECNSDQLNISWPFLSSLLGRCNSKATANPTKSDFYAFITCFWAYVRQPHGHIGWATPMPFASINKPILLTKGPIHEIFAKKYWELAELENDLF